MSFSNASLSTLALCIALGLSGAASAQESAAPKLTMQEVEAAWAQQDFVKVRGGLKVLAEEGMPFAMYRYGRVLLQGLGGPKDQEGAEFWLEKAIEADQPNASVLLARLLLTKTEDGTARDPERAAQLLKAAAPLGNHEAQYYLARLYQKGEGVAKSGADAFNWMRASAIGGYVDAQFSLSRHYSRAKDSEQTLYWLNEAAGQGHREAQYFLGYALDQGKGAKQNREQGFEWLLRSAEGGFIPAQVGVGRKYLSGDGVPTNGAEAQRWLQIAAQSGSAEAMTSLAKGHLAGDVVELNEALALNLLQKAVQRGSPKAMIALAGMLEQAQGGAERDLEEAVKLYRTALDLGFDEASLELGRLASSGALAEMLAPHRMVPWVMSSIENGDEAALVWLRAQAAQGLRPAQTALGIWAGRTEGAPDDAVALLTNAATAGDARAQYELGLLYITGEGVELDYVQAHKWVNIAAARGVEAAAEKRDVLVDLMTPEQIAEAQTAAREFFDQASAPTEVKP